LVRPPTLADVEEAIINYDERYIHIANTDTFAVVVVTDAKVAFCHNEKVVYEAALTTPFLLQGVTLFRGPGARTEGVRFLTGRQQPSQANGHKRALDEDCDEGVVVKRERWT